MFSLCGHRSRLFMLLVSEFVKHHTILHPANRNQIVERLEKAVSHTVLGDPMNAGVMPDGHLGHRESIH